MLVEIAVFLERHVELPPPQFDLGIRLGDDAPLADAERAANQLRIAWRTPEGPVANVVRSLEARGALVAAWHVRSRLVRSPFERPIVLSSFSVQRQATLRADVSTQRTSS